MCKSSLPLDRAGTAALPKLPSREMVDEYLTHQHINEEILTEHFSMMFQKFLSNMISKNYEGLEKVVETRFLNQLKSQSENLGKFDLKYEPNSVEEIVKSSYLID